MNGKTDKIIAPCLPLLTRLVVGTIPTLAVPMIETTGPGVDTRFRTLRDTIVSPEQRLVIRYLTHQQTICDFLDQARSSHSSRTVSDRPAPTLAPATIEGEGSGIKTSEPG